MNKPAGGCISHDSPEKQSQWDVERGDRRFITGNGLPCYEGHKVPPSATCKPENQESWWCDSAESEGLRVKGPMVEVQV